MDPNSICRDIMLRNDWRDFEDNGDIGDWAFIHDDKNNVMYLWFWYFDEINQKNEMSGIPVYLAPFPDMEEVFWGWDGNKESPTLIPTPKSSLVSVRILGPNEEGPDRFHKSLVSGKWV